VTLFKTLISWISIALLICVVVNLATVMVAEFPPKAAARNNAIHSLAADCKLVGVNEELSKVVQTLNQHGEGISQRLINNQLTIQRGDTQCIVDFDAVTRRSTKAEIVQLPSFEKAGR
jgi:hypothetical protein